MELHVETCSSDVIEPGKIYDLMGKRGAGSVVLHFAVVKPMEGASGTTGHIDYAQAGDAQAELRGIAEALCDQFTLADVILVRRTGRLRVGDIISLVAASSPCSEDAFEACKQGLVQVKRMKTILKDEVYA
jgi:molybdopterin synthase catalytic subunit